MNTRHAAFVLAFTLLSVSACRAQTKHAQHFNAKLSPTEFRVLARACAPDIPLVTLRAISRTESAFHPYAVSLDHPQRTAREQGFDGGEILLGRQPRTLGEARGWAKWLMRHGRSVSVGLMQVSTQHATDLGLTADDLFDPCTNIRAGAELLKAEYQHAAAQSGEGQQALREALSQYNSGSSVLGFDNGYVWNVIDGEFYKKQ